MVDATNNDDADMWASVFPKDANCYMKHQVFDPAEAVSRPPKRGSSSVSLTPTSGCFPLPRSSNVFSIERVVRFDTRSTEKGDHHSGYMQLNFDADAKITSAMVDIPK